MTAAGSELQVRIISFMDAPTNLLSCLPFLRHQAVCFFAAPESAPPVSLAGLLKRLCPDERMHYFANLIFNLIFA
jgi:hypothetical protein